MVKLRVTLVRNKWMHTAIVEVPNRLKISEVKDYVAHHHLTPGDIIRKITYSVDDN